MCQVNQLDVKTEPIDLRRFNQRAARAHPECFEAALRVPKRKTCRQTNHQIKHPATLFPSPGLMDADQTSIQRSRAECQVAFPFSNWINKFRYLSNRRGKIGVRKKRNVRA